ncbi:S66 peptidase family protein [Thiovibrio sp. JS02]
MNAIAEPIRPAALKRGDTIGIVAPAGPLLNEGEFAAGLKILGEMGFQTRHLNSILRRQEYLAGSDRERAEELHTLWRDPEVKAIVAARGGYGCLRLLPLLDFELIRRHPKILVGFSDLTVLLAAVTGRTGLITFHGPMLTTLARSERTFQEAFRNLLLGRENREIKAKGLEILKAGAARGPLLVGNLTNLVHLIGTPFEPDYEGRILIVEEIGEASYRIDRLLTHLAAAGRLDRIAGLVLGGFDQCGDVEVIWQRAIDLLAQRPIPIWANFPVGHGGGNLILPFGALAGLDSAGGRLTLLEQLTS